MEKIELFLTALKQPSTIKGLLGLATVLGVRVTPQGYEDVITGIATIYFLIAIFWQKS